MFKLPTDIQGELKSLIKEEKNIYGDFEVATTFEDGARLLEALKKITNKIDKLENIYGITVKHNHLLYDKAKKAYEDAYDLRRLTSPTEKEEDTEVAQPIALARK